ncbi:hypothetical protein TNCV_819381 [Trichonephila clavipes]|nr:hypothetical protein TNCV_819381 [Trichonephila clavipes]
MKFGPYNVRRKSDTECKDLVPILLTCQSTSIEHMKVSMPVCHDAYQDHQITSTIVALFDIVREPISTPGFFRGEKISRVSVQIESQRITEENSPPIILCPRMVVSQENDEIRNFMKFLRDRIN